MNDHSKEISGSCCTPGTGQTQYRDPVCGIGLDGHDVGLSTIYAGVEYFFCSSHCLKVFQNKKEAILAGKGQRAGKNRAVQIGIAGSVTLIALFLIVVVFANGNLAFAISEIRRLWYWVMILSLGFGLQLGLFIHIRHTLQQRLTGATAEVAASGAVSTGSMIACCSHGIANLLPIFGISAAATFLARYQLPFILFGIFSNLIGVTIMTGLAQKNGIEFTNRILQAITRLNMNLTRAVLILSGIITISIAILVS